MINTNGLKQGDKVRFVDNNKPVERGIVKRVADNQNAFVVYNCNDDWDNYENYTAANTHVRNLIKGW